MVAETVALKGYGKEVLCFMVAERAIPRQLAENRSCPMMADAEED